MSKADFFKAAALAVGSVEVDGFGMVELHELNLTQRLTLSELADGDQDVARAKVVVMGCDLFDESDIEKLCSIKSNVLLTLYSKVMELSGVGGKAKKP